MKKSVFVVAAMLAASVGFSQNLTSNKGEAYLPETGDRALGFDAVPVLNVFKFNTSDKVSAKYVDGVSIFGKRFHDANTAARYGVSFNWGTTKSTIEVADLSNGAGENQFVENDSRVNNFATTLTLGHEHRRGSGRVQGYGGAEGILSLGSGSVKNEFGNTLADVYADNGTDSRILEQKGAFSFGIGARAFMGVEFFIAPKLSVGAEYGLGLMFSSVKGGESTIEEVTDNGGDVTVTKSTIDNNDWSRSFMLGNDVNKGAVRMTFHF
ncbi:MAG: hypothetical protein ACJAY8_000391 [Sphingobacteriales bacterium]|jgi:hypothetical protein